MSVPNICNYGERARNVNDFNSEYLYRCWQDETEAAKKPRKGATTKSAVFYLSLVMLVLLSFFYSGNKSPAKRIGPFAYNTVLTPSMRSVYPPGSLIFSWALKPGEPVKAGLVAGTDIVYTKDESGMLVVHRIIEVIENYEDIGIRAFRTQGVNNPSPDPWLAFEENVVGRVMGHVPYAGDVLAVIAENVLWIVGIIAVLVAVITLLKIVFGKAESPRPQTLSPHRPGSK